MTVYDFDNTIYDGESTFDYFLFCLRRLGLKNAVCSSADLAAGKITRLCFRENKPELFAALFPNQTVEAFYTDSLNDRPMMLYAEKCYSVRREKVTPVDKRSL